MRGVDEDMDDEKKAAKQWAVLGRWRGTGAFKWWVRQDAWQKVQKFISSVEEKADPSSSPHWKLIRQTKNRRVWRCSLGGGEGKALYVKEFLPRGPKSYIRWLLRMDHARTELETSIRLKELGIHTYEVLALGLERAPWRPARSMLISEELEGAEPLVSLLGSGDQIGWRERTRLIGDLGSFAALCHQKGLDHGDFHGGNLLGRLMGGQWAFYWVDLNRLRLRRRLSRRRIIRSLAMMLHALDGYLDREEQGILLESYLRICPVDVPRDQLEKEKQRYMLRWQKSKTKKCLGHGSSYRRKDNGRLRIYHKRRFPIDEFLNTLDEMEILLSSPDEMQGKVKKLTARTAVVVWPFHSGSGSWNLCIKYYRDRGLLDRMRYILRSSRAERAWVAGNALEVRGIKAPNVWACIVDKRSLISNRGFLVMEEVSEARPVPRYFLQRFHTDMSNKEEPSSRHKERFLISIAEFFLELHEKRVYHKDLKASNILVLEEGDDWRFSVVDFEDIRFNRRLTLRERARNIKQFLSSFPYDLDVKDKGLIVRSYADGLLGGERETLLRSLNQWCKSSSSR
jgi:tRNA A-37 threonylcarbamoyl transferase component Bud32